MNTPIVDFVTKYAASGISRLHMPGHKGALRLGIEDRDITEIAGADVLYEADGIIAESEANATALFGTGRTVYSTEGSSLVIRAMLYLALLRWKRTAQAGGGRPVLLAARNAHKVLLFAAALLDFDIEWLYPEDIDLNTICSCHPAPESVAARLERMDRQPFAVYLTSPDYLGFSADIPAIAWICRAHGLPLLVDNAHGAYTHFLEPSMHPIDLGAYMCSDSAHKTLPCLTGGAYLQMSREAADELGAEANDALALFGSTSPSYVIMQSLDLCNAYMDDGYREKLADLILRLDGLRSRLRSAGINVPDVEPLKLTVDAASIGMSGLALADRLRSRSIEVEFADVQYVVFMFTPDNSDLDFERVEAALLDAVREASAKDGAKTGPRKKDAGPDDGASSSTDRIAAGPADGASSSPAIRLRPLRRVMTVREAIMSMHEAVPVDQAAGRICGQPSVSCPPAIPIAVSGELLDEEVLEVFRAYDIDEISVVAGCAPD